MPITVVLFLAALAVLTGLLPRARGLALLAVSALLVFWLQPRFDDPSANFWVPAATLFIAVMGWALTAPPEALRDWKRNLPALGVLAGAALLVSANRYFQWEAFFDLRTPRLTVVLAAWLAVAVLAALILGLGGRRRWLIPLAALGLIGLLALIKSPDLSTGFYNLVMRLRGRDVQTAWFSLQWLGFSYVSFRLLHTFFDRRSGRLPAVALDEYVNYVIFFPAFSAGPIDRLERFVQDLRQPQPLDADGWLFSGQRFFAGLFKKFVLADALALLSLDALDTAFHGAGWTWLLVYLYALRIFLDFSGYTDMAIGLGRLLGVRLPENFAAPYRKPNLTQFWNSWHMTLTQWFRAYFFNPMLRWFRGVKRPLPGWLTVLLLQISTMVLIGLWHGITWNFIAWGLWHGLGLFVHNRWNERTRARAAAWAVTPARKMLLQVSGILLTFHFVALGWVWFALPDIPASLAVFARLFGMG